MRICTVVGARPQFVKAAVVSPAMEAAGIEETLVHTGQHYDRGMSDVFFQQLRLREPSVNLGIGSASHAIQTAQMLTAIAEFLETDSGFDGVLVYGDTNSTLAAALSAAKLHIPVLHVEAGLRSYNRRMPEEHNRVVTDRLSQLLFCPTKRAVENLKLEGMTAGVHLSGDVMYEGLQNLRAVASAMTLESIDSRISEVFYLATVHRPSNVDDTDKLDQILRAFERIGEQVVFPVHPRTARQLAGKSIPSNVLTISPVGYLEMMALVERCQVVLTDSGGLQKESVWLGTPCITLREETEWVETLTGDWNQLAGSDTDKIAKALGNIPSGSPHIEDDGNASKCIVDAILEWGMTHA